MRKLTTALSLAILLVLTGCNSWLFRRDAHAPQAGRFPTETPTAEALVAYLNNNARLIYNLRCTDLDLDCKEGIQSIGLVGQMVCQKPRNFRMTAKLISNTAVDVGSNDREFWFWVRDSKHLFHCSYEDYARGNVNLPFPFQPEWVMEALGLAEYNRPPENYRVQVVNSQIHLIEQAVSAQGKPVQKIVVFSGAAARSHEPQVRAHILRDSATGKDICAAYTEEVQVDRNTSTVLPKRIRLVWPEQKLEMRMKLDGLAVNAPLNEQDVTALFTRPILTNIPGYDLARGPDGPPAAVERAGGLRR